MEGTLTIVSCGVNEIHGQTVFSDATSEWHVQGYCFANEQEIQNYVDEIRLEDEGFRSAVFEDELGIETYF